MVYFGLNAEYLPPKGASGNYLPGGLKKCSTQKVITLSDSTQKIVQENVFCFYGTILYLVNYFCRLYSQKSNISEISMQKGEQIHAVPLRLGFICHFVSVYCTLYTALYEPWILSQPWPQNINPDQK